MPAWLKSLNDILLNFPVGNVADWVTLVSFLITFFGFFFTLIGVYKSKGAAEAARASAMDAVRGVRFVQAVASLQEICSLSRELLEIVKAKKSTGKAATMAFNLREAMVRFRTVSMTLEPPENWNSILDTLENVHNRLESAALTNRIDNKEREILIHEISTIHLKLSEFSAKTTTGGTNANSK